LEAGSLKQRILQLLGTHYNAKVVAVKEEMDYLNIYGFVGKPETAKRRGAINTFCEQPFH
jgi:DNA mismatch repair protein MutL